MIDCARLQTCALHAGEFAMGSWADPLTLFELGTLGLSAKGLKASRLILASSGTEPRQSQLPTGRESHNYFAVSFVFPCTKLPCRQKATGVLQKAIQEVAQPQEAHIALGQLGSCHLGVCCAQTIASNMLEEPGQRHPLTYDLARQLHILNAADVHLRPAHREVDNLDNSLACHKPALQVQPSHSILKGDVMQDHLPEALGGTRQRAEASQALHRQRMCIKESSMLPPQETAPCPGCRPPQEAGHPSGASCPIQPSSSTLRATGQQDTTRTSRLKF